MEVSVWIEVRGLVCWCCWVVFRHFGIELGLCCLVCVSVLVGQVGW